MNEPIILTSQTALTAASSVPVALDSGRLMNTYREPIEVREIRIHTYVAHAAGDVVSGLPGMVDFDLVVGRHAITKSAVPLGMVFSPLYNEPVDGNASTDPAVIKIATGIGQRWRLDTPFVIPPGGGFGGSLAMNPVYTVAGVTVSAISVTVAIIGRFVQSDAWKREQPIPYLSAWRSGLNPGTVRTIATPQHTFENVFDRPMRVHRFTALNFARSAGPTMALPSRLLTATLRGPSDNGVMQDYLQGEPLALGYFFDQNASLFMGRHDLASRQCYEWTFFDPATTVGTTDFVALAMIGDRMEVLG